MKIWSFAKRAFMTFWYGYVKNLNLILPSITIQGKRLIVFPDVYKPLENEYACADYCREGDRMLDLGCGSGIGAVVCAPKVRELVAVDISPSAVKNTEENCRLNRLNNVVVKQSDMFSGVEGKFDLILANPISRRSTKIRKSSSQLRCATCPLFSHRSVNTSRMTVGFSFNFRCGSGAGSKDLGQSKV
jgi:SAM-dependent methyltransferase